MNRLEWRPRRPRWLATAAMLASIALLLLLPCGCEELFGGPTRPKGFVNVGSSSVLILPFATPSRKPFESELGRSFSEAIAELVRQGCRAAKVLSADHLPGTINGVDIAQLPAVAVGQAVGARYVAFGEIHELRSKDPGSYKVLHGTMVISARVFDTKEAELVWRLDRRTYHYPRLALGEVIPSEIQDEEEVIRRVMTEAAWAVAAVFRGSRTSEEIRLGN
ncbi:MAG TPA: hypothetical protein VNE39_11285 [Planctomycetota bacterium]|nr:hypothetical protein [Planctomycetota bacterium]